MVLVLGLKEAAPKVLETILTTLLEAIEEKAVLRQIAKDPQRYRKNGHQQQAAQVQLFDVRFFVSLRPG